MSLLSIPCFLWLEVESQVNIPGSPCPFFSISLTQLSLVGAVFVSLTWPLGIPAGWHKSPSGPYPFPTAPEIGPQAVGNLRPGALSLQRLSFSKCMENSCSVTPQSGLSRRPKVTLSLGQVGQSVMRVLTDVPQGAVGYGHLTGCCCCYYCCTAWSWPDMRPLSLCCRQLIIPQLSFAMATHPRCQDHAGVAVILVFSLLCLFLWLI